MTTIERDREEVLDVFRTINGAPTYRQPTATERRKLIARYFPAIEKPIEEILATGAWRDDDDVEVFGRMIGSILQADATPPGTRGRRAPLDMAAAAERLRQLLRGEHTTERFADALRLLSGWQPGRNGSAPAGAITLTALARRVGISRSRLHRLLHGEDEPTVAECESAAAGFRKHPSYFVEWRTQYVMDRFADRLREMPDVSIDLYRQAIAAR